MDARRLERGRGGAAGGGGGGGEVGGGVSERAQRHGVIEGRKGLEKSSGDQHLSNSSNTSKIVIALHLLVTFCAMSSVVRPNTYRIQLPLFFESCRLEINIKNTMMDSERFF